VRVNVWTTARLSGRKDEGCGGEVEGSWCRLFGVLEPHDQPVSHALVSGMSWHARCVVKIARGACDERGGMGDGEGLPKAC
jgi:hypothetical protein